MRALREILKPEVESRRVSRFVLILTAEHAYYGEPPHGGRNHGLHRNGRLGLVGSRPETSCRQLADSGRYVIRYDNRDTGISTSYR
jgi:hypothetical protein